MTPETPDVVDPEVRASRVRNAAATIRGARDKEAKRRAEAVGLAASQIRRALQSECSRFRWELEAVVQRALGEGVVPSLLRAAGLSHLERPFNTLLAWWAEVDAEHGLGRSFLMALGEAISFDRLVDDLAQGDIPYVLAEQAPAAAMWSRQPDLMVRTRNAALLVENKVDAAESGEGQYADYLDLLNWWAEGRATRAVLLARDQREVPDGYDLMVTHAELAAVFRGLAGAADRGSRWGRTCAAIMAATLDDEVNRQEVEWHREARRLFTSPPSSPGAEYCALMTLAVGVPAFGKQRSEPAKGRD